MIHLIEDIDRGIEVGQTRLAEAEVENLWLEIQDSDTVQTIQSLSSHE